MIEPSGRTKKKGEPLVRRFLRRFAWFLRQATRLKAERTSRSARREQGSSKKTPPRVFFLEVDGVVSMAVVGVVDLVF